MSELSDASLGDFLDGVGARTPAPAAGAVAAVTVASAASLVAMAARFAQDANGDDGSESAAEAERVRQEVLALGQADGEAYGAVLEALRIPRSQPQRQEQIDQALEGATEIPLRIARAGSRVGALAARLVREGNPSLAADAQAAALLAQGATAAAASLVRANQSLGRLPESWIGEVEAYEQDAQAAASVLLGDESPE
ncbi:MAG: cyclodeaminase/cyclohydrolase family protein [Nocardioidaceae bacterium]